MESPRVAVAVAVAAAEPSNDYLGGDNAVGGVDCVQCPGSEALSLCFDALSYHFLFLSAHHLLHVLCSVV